MVENKKEIVNEIIKQRNLPYSLDLIEVQGDKYIVRNNFSSTIVYIKKGDKYILEDD